jgi:hypothetical protein
MHTCPFRAGVSINQLSTQIITLMYLDKTSNGISFSEEIASINGASFLLFPDEIHTKEMIDKAKKEIRDSRDVVSIRVANDRDRDEQYRWDIFKNPLVRKLRWYEINADDYTLIRKERLNGTQTQDYIERYVLPCIADTVQTNFDRIGYKIFEP